eukprot:JZ553089.1.p1 GENE.JZ553089.1~~JZ553089.1.p1  ORF type:complete len:206 (+),score=77.41 JZ553089.1:14-631(+)
MRSVFVLFVIAAIALSASAVEEKAKPKVLVTYAEWYTGSTLPYAIQIAHSLREKGLEVDVRPVDQVYSVSRYARVVVGGVQYGSKTKDELAKFFETNKKDLATVPLAMFAIVPTGTAFAAEEQEARDASALAWAKSLAAPAVPCCAKALPGAVEYANHPFMERAVLFLSGVGSGDSRDFSAARIWAVASLRRPSKLTCARARDVM